MVLLGLRRAHDSEFGGGLRLRVNNFRCTLTAVVFTVTVVDTFDRAGHGLVKGLGRTIDKGAGLPVAPLWRRFCGRGVQSPIEWMLFALHLLNKKDRILLRQD